MCWSVAKIVGPVVVLLSIGCMLFLDVKDYLKSSERYRVKSPIEVSGSDRVSDEEIIACSGISADSSIVSVDRKTTEARITKHHRISDATVAVTLPNCVSIKIVERVPVALVLFNKPYEIDANGLILGQYEKGISPEGPIISGVKKPEPVKEGITLRDEGLSEALELWSVFSADPITKKLTVSEIDVSDSNSLIMFFSNKRYEMRWPREDFAACLLRLKAAWEKSGGFPGARRYVDLRFDYDVPTK
jgi:cell division protein FtsQ